VPANTLPSDRLYDWGTAFGLDTEADVGKRKVLERLTDVPRHSPVGAAMETFGEGFGPDQFARAVASEDPSELNSVKAIERRVDQLFN
jgi:hypothetical protein